MMKNILMNTEMTKAILDGCKTQTRRVIKLPIDFNIDDLTTVWESYKSNKIADIHFEDYDNEDYLFIKPKYQIGETIWVREPARVVSWWSGEHQDTMHFQYSADKLSNRIIIPNRLVKNLDYPKWITMSQGIPNGCIKEMARTFLKITDVRVERLQDISWEDAKAEGGRQVFDNEDRCPECGMPASEYETGFIEIWNKTAPKGYKWEDNPYVFVYEFERVEK